MRRIQELVSQIDEELEGAKGYAECALDHKAHGDSKWYGRYREMAEDELKHAGYIHDRAVEEIDKLSAVYTPPAEMEAKWMECHRAYVEKAAWVKTMLNM